MAGKAGAGNGAESEDLHLRTYLHRSYATTLRKTPAVNTFIYGGLARTGLSACAAVVS